jgi:hypothetical protein
VGYQPLPNARVNQFFSCDHFSLVILKVFVIIYVHSSASTI